MPRDLLNLFDYQERAKEIMPRAVWERVYGGAFDEITERRARPAYESILLRPKMLRNVANRDTSTTVLGHKISLPVMTAAPSSHLRYGHPDGEQATCRGAHAAGTLMILSHASNKSLEDVAAVADGPIWAQIYVYEDMEYTRESIQRAEDAGYSAIVLTVSAVAPGIGAKEKDRRGKYNIASAAHGSEMRLDPDGVWRRTVPGPFNASIDWSIIDWVRGITDLPVVIKGLLSPLDGEECVKNGAVGLVVSNHGARLVDGMMTSIEALPAMVDAVDGQAEVYIDSGIRRGIDVLKAVALGARACLIGKPLFFALAVNGAEGIRHNFEILQKELDFAMAMCGARTIDDIDRSMVTRPMMVPF